MRLQRFKNCFTAIDKRAGDRAETLPLLSVSQYRGVVPRSALAGDDGRAADLSIYKVCSAGDIVLNRMSAYNGAVGLANMSGLVSPDYLVLRPTPDHDGRFLTRLIQSHWFVGEMTSRVRGIGSVDSGAVRTPRIGLGDLGEIRVAFPSRQAQAQIADYLDRETAQIDAFIAKNEELIALLTERRVAAINREFQNQPSNARIGHACESVVDCPHTTPPFDEDGEFEAVRTASVRDGKFRPNQGIRVNRRTWLDRNGSRGPRIGDILFTREAPAGEACMVPSTQICLGQRMVLLRIDPSKAHGDFVLWQLYSHKVATHFERAANGSTVTNIRLPLLRATPIWLPSLDTQSNVLQRLKAVGDKTDAAIATAHSAIELAKERRAALISAAVTGKIDVSREASAV